MKHVYSGTELRGGGAKGTAAADEKKAPAGNGRRSAGRGAWVFALAVAVLAAGAGGAAWWRANRGREASDKPFPQRFFLPGGEAAGESAESYLRMGPLQVQQLFEFVRSSAHVQGNPAYREALGRVRFTYGEGEDEVNAYAAPDGAGGAEIRCEAGAVRFARLISLGLAAELAGREGAVQALLGRMGADTFERLTERDGAALLREAGLADGLADAAVRENAKSIASGMLTFALAHESGHQALGHLAGKAETAEAARNQEREADAFASSVTSTSSYGEYLFAGTLFWHYAMAQREEGKSGGGKSHPLAAERLENLIRQNPEKAAAFGIAAEGIGRSPRN